MKFIAPPAGAALYTWLGGASVAVTAAATLVVSAALYARIRPRPVITPAAPSATPPAPPNDTASAALTPLNATAPASPNATATAAPTPPNAAAPAAHTRSNAGPLPPDPPAPSDIVAPGARKAMRFLMTRPRLRGIVLTGSVAVGMSGLTTAAVYEVITKDLRLPPTFVGVLGSAQGAGSILSGIVAGRLINRFGAARVAAAGAIGFGIGNLLRCLPWAGATIAGSVVIGIALPWTIVAMVTAVQRETPDRIVGGVAATASMAVFAPVALTTPAGAALIALAGHRVTLITATIVACGAAIWLAPRHAPTTGHRRLASPPPT